MNFIRKHWYDIGGILALMILAKVYAQHTTLTHYQLLMWLSLVSLFVHQLEEYRIVGTFPGMVNRCMYNSKMPDRYPLNTQTSLVVNVVVGWLMYVLAALLAEQAVWMGMATMMVSLGNTVAHTTVFNLKGKTLYNAGLATCWLFFAPCVGYFMYLIYVQQLATLTDYLIGIPLGVVLNVIGIVKLIDWMADIHTSYVFDKRNLLPQDR